MSAKHKNKQENWQERLAAESGLAVIISDESSPELSASNNNSMCRVLYSSEEFAPSCDQYCGKAFEMATEAGETVGYQCYAGLDCLAVPFKSEEKQLVAIVGRTFQKADNYREATERAITGDWQKFLPTDFFENILLSTAGEKLENLAVAVENLSAEEKDALLEFLPPQTAEALDENADSHQNHETYLPVEQFQTPAQIEDVSESVISRNIEEVDELAMWRSLFGSLLSLTYIEACAAVLAFVEKRYKVRNLAWLERRENQLQVVTATGKLENQALQIDMVTNDERLLETARSETAMEMRERTETAAPQMTRLFPMAVGSEVRSALMVSDEISDDKTKRQIARFGHSVASELEILRLRGELSRRAWRESALQKLNESLKNIDTEDFWAQLIQTSSELLRAERGSLLLFDEKENVLTAKAATGARADIIQSETVDVGKRVARKVLRNGRPFIVTDIKVVRFPPAPPEWNYKTDSFISYPITIGNRKIGVLNFTDKVGGEIYDEFDLELLDTLAPQIAVAIDRVSLKHKAGQFQQLSVTDSLTGLLNRLYLDERLPEEVIRSHRHGFPMSFLMIDVDDFKSYNDAFGHPEGDRALKLVAQNLKEALRGEDVAVRYGGEEFSILLPQTAIEEAIVIAERIRHKIENTKFPNRQVTVSIGVASASLKINSAEDLMDAADKALYEAKHQGRNQVRSYENLNREIFVDEFENTER